MEGDHGDVEGIRVRCTRCEHECEVYGTSLRSVRRGLVMLREECPYDESNFYTANETDREE